MLYIIMHYIYSILQMRYIVNITLPLESITILENHRI